eukprot:gnl/MRDRNA2_/MRDRNA2_121086_c0_seq1.p1 gnl/MRDRNA2_/MRDRNA2_121086_c0~~gnl/MRDRNA2_/MRDRNA2_121086_c0_seq1.p1  ORF type:complete len:196 (-),score=27.90 gnl/MRDRNA2_/MRDRNA2_121086_c0_seq1:26-613(-)
MDFLQSTAYNHRALGDLWRKERNANQNHEVNQGHEAPDAFDTPAKRYRPIVGVSGTLQATPNPCMERDRLRAHSVHTRLPKLSGAATNPEVNLNVHVPPHQVHHHHYGWTSAGNDAKATFFSPRRPYGIGLHYANTIAPVHRRIADCPVPPPPAPMSGRRVVGEQGKAFESTQTASTVLPSGSIDEFSPQSSLMK